MIRWLGLLVFIISAVAIPEVNGQSITIPVNQTEPCFLNYSAGAQMWRNCGADVDYIDFALMGFQWVTGGYFSMIIVSLFVMVSYIKYHKAVYPLLIGIIFLPISYFLFPDPFITFGALLIITLFGILITYAYLKQTKEY